MKNILKSLIPPPQWKIPVVVTLGVLAGLGMLILRISNATAYLSNDPQACINCHVMTTQYISWQKSSHARFATCADCHVPQDNFIRTYMFKASDGLRHAYMFTFRLEPQVIQIKDAGTNVVQENCIRCHANQLHRTAAINFITVSMREAGEGKFCWECHRETPHGVVRSLSAFPDARIPQLNPILPKWLEDFTRTDK